MNEKFNKNAKVEKITTTLGIAVRLIVNRSFRVIKHCFINTQQNTANEYKIANQKLGNTRNFIKRLSSKDIRNTLKINH